METLKEVNHFNRNYVFSFTFKAIKWIGTISPTHRRTLIYAKMSTCSERKEEIYVDIFNNNKINGGATMEAIL